MGTPTSVYRYLDADGVLIYVGITNRGVQRQGEHNTHAKWWRFVRSQDVEHYDDRETALRRERHLIEKHQPPFNVVHNAEHPRRLAAYLKHADPELKRCGHCEGCQLDAAGENDGDPYGCQWWWADDPDEEPELCSVCGSKTCLYTIGHHDGGVEGWQAGFRQGEEYSWDRAHRRYLPEYTADLTLRMVVDGRPSTRAGGTISLGIWEAEKALRALQADIDAHGIAALVDKAAKVPF
jgi:predicted GIY-YIG superfamily endonuclease